jgi:hypothetical protein
VYYFVYWFIQFICFFERGSHCIAQLALNLRFSCFCLLSAGIIGVHNHVWSIGLFCYFRGPAGTTEIEVGDIIIPIPHCHGKGMALWKRASYTDLEGPVFWRVEFKSVN